MGPPEHDACTPAHLVFADSERTARRLFAAHVEWAVEIAHQYPAYIAARARRAPEHDHLLAAFLLGRPNYAGEDGVVPTHEQIEGLQLFAEC